MAKDIRSVRFTILVNSLERRWITAIAEHLNRSQSDSIRFLIRLAMDELSTANISETTQSVVIPPEKLNVPDEDK